MVELWESVIPPRKPVSWAPREQLHDQRYDLGVVNGVPQNPHFKEETINTLLNTFKGRSDDVYVCTYVKSGTTWTQQILHLLRNGGEQGDKVYGQTCPWLEATTVLPGPLNDRESGGYIVDDIDAIPEDQRRFFKTHANVKDMPKDGADSRKVIYVARNPKDVAVSLQHHATNKPDFHYTGAFSTLLHYFAEGLCENGSWFNHVLEWWEESQKKPDNILFLKYEDMLADAEGSIKKIAEFLGLPLSPEVLAKVTAGSTMDAMKNNVKANIGLGHLRKGGSGGWRDVFTVRESETFDEVYRSQMEGSGLTMDFGEGLVM